MAGCSSKEALHALLDMYAFFDAVYMSGGISGNVFDCGLSAVHKFACYYWFYDVLLDRLL